MLRVRTERLIGNVCVLLILISCVSAVSSAEDSVANVAGTWTVDVSGGGLEATQTLVIQQEGAKISGTFKGPRQSGTLEGAVSGNAVTFHVQARIPLDYTGTADGDSMKGTLSGRGRTGNWTATRSK
jgi:hypothetical protein